MNNMLLLSVSCSREAIGDVKKMYPSWDQPTIQKWIVNRVRKASYINTDEKGVAIFEDDDLRFLIEKKSNKQSNAVRVLLKSMADENEDGSLIFKENIKYEQNSKSHITKSELGNLPVVVTSHAIEEAMNDNPHFKNPAEARMWIIDSVLKANLIDDSVVGVHNLHQGYCTKKMGLHLLLKKQIQNT